MIRCAVQQLSVNLPPMTNLYDGHDMLGVVHNVENPELALAESISILAREFLAARGTRIVLESVDLVDDAVPVGLPAYSLEFFRGGWLDEELIVFHCASGL